MKISPYYGSQNGTYSSDQRSNAVNTDEYATSQKKQILINWVNSIEYPNCLLASDVLDFRDDSLHNINMALNEIKALKGIEMPVEIQQLKSHELVSNEDKVLNLLEFLYTIAHTRSSGKQAESNMHHEPPAQNSNFETFNQRPSHQQSVSSHQVDSSRGITPQQTQLNNFNKVTQKPPRNSSIPSNRVKSPGPSQPTKTSNINTVNTDYSRDYPPHPDTLTDHQKSASSFPKTTNSALFNNYQQSNMSSYEEQFDHSQQQLNSDNFSPLYSNTKDRIKYESSNMYNSNPRTQGEEYSEFPYNESFQNEAEVTRSARKGDATKSEPNSHRFLQTPLGEGQKKKTQGRNPSATFISKSQLTPIQNNSRPLSPESTSIPQNHKGSQDKKPLSFSMHFALSQNNQKVNSNNEQKLRTSEVQQRINELQKKKEQSNSVDKKVKTNEGLFSFKRTEGIISSIKSMETDRKIAWETQKDEDKVTVTPVTEEIRLRILNWLYSITLLKENVKDVEKLLPKICKNGVIFIDLINRLEGKHETIKGVNRNPDTKTLVLTNYQKLMNYLGKFEKMNPRYLWAYRHLMEGDENVFWGLLDDIWHLYNKKISPYDPRYSKDNQKLTNSKFHSSSRGEFDKSRNPFEMSYNDILYFDKARLSTSNLNSALPRNRSKSPSEYGGFERGQDDHKNLNISGGKKIETGYNSRLENSVGLLDDQSRPSKYDSNRNAHSNNEGYSQKNYSNKNLNQPRKSIIKKGDNSKFFSRSFHEDKSGEVSSRGVGTISVDTENEVIEWLKNMGFKALLMRERTSLFDDPFRNGTLLCYVVGRIENERMHSTYKEPKSIDECRHNVYQGFQVLARKQSAIPTYLKGKEESFLKGDREIIFGLFYSLMKISDNKTEANNSVLISGEKSIRQEVSMYIPPYDDNENEQLEQSLIKWMYSLGLFNDSLLKPKSFRELAILMKSGVLLCDLTGIITNEKLKTVHRRPANELQCITNIRRALEALRSKKSMGQKYLWKERDIYTGNRIILLGLLEDMRRFFDGVPPRTNPNYFLDGPYIPADYDSTDSKEQHLNGLHSGIQTTSNANILSSSRRGQSNPAKSPNDSRLLESKKHENGLRSRDQASKLNLSSDEPISIIDYERNNLKGSLNSIVVQQNVEGYANSMNSSGNGWKGQKENNLYKSPQSDKRKLIQSGSSNFIERPKETNPYLLFSKNSSREERQATLTSEDLKLIKSEMISPRRFDIKEWLFSLGLGPQIRDVDFDTDVIEELKDGVVLCKVIEALELRELPGVILKPRTNASKMVNIKKCLNALTKRPNINPHYLHIEDKLLAGDGETIRKLLKNIKEAYKFMDKCVQKTQSPSASRFMDSMPSERKSMRNSGEKWQLYRPQESYVLNPKEREKVIVSPKYSRD